MTIDRESRIASIRRHLEIHKSFGENDGTNAADFFALDVRFLLDALDHAEKRLNDVQEETSRFLDAFNSTSGVLGCREDWDKEVNRLENCLAEVARTAREAETP